MARRTTIHLISVPYELGRGQTGMGLGPQRLLEAGAAHQVRAGGSPVRLSSVRWDGEFRHEIGAAFAVAGQLASRVKGAIAHAELPLVLAGDCSASLGVLAGLDSTPGIVWFDAHGDFNTPETTITGYFGGMPLAAAVGRCWQEMCGRLPGFRPIAEANVILVGARALDPLEARLLEGSRVQVVASDAIRQRPAEALAPPLEMLRNRVMSVYVHVDMDVLDPEIARTNSYAEPGGLSVEDVEIALRAVGEHLPMAAATLAAYDPLCDETGAAEGAGVRLLVALAEASSSRGGVAGV